MKTDVLFHSRDSEKRIFNSPSTSYSWGTKLQRLLKCWSSLSEAVMISVENVPSSSLISEARRNVFAH